MVPVLASHTSLASASFEFTPAEGTDGPGLSVTVAAVAVVVASAIAAAVTAVKGDHREPATAPGARRKRG